MPFYDLRCVDCDHEFRVMASISERAGRLIPCPECGSADLETVFKSAPAYIKSLNASGCPNSHVCGAGCSHSH